MTPSPDHPKREPAEPARLLGALAMGLLLAFPSSAFIQKYAGFTGLAAYTVFVLLAVLMLRRLSPHFLALVDRHFRWFATAALAGLLGCHLALHPFEDGRGPGRSSDRDEGLEFAVTRLLDGENPYYPSNKVAGPLSVLPGAILLAVPFVKLGAVGVQNWFWLTAFFFSAAWFFRDRAFALLLLIVPMALSPAAQYEYVSGGDLLANGAYVSLFLLFALTCWTKEKLHVPAAVISAIVLGIGLSSRANFPLLLPLFTAFIWKNAGLGRSIIASAVASASFATVTLPFYLLDPAAFTPLGSRNKIMIANQPALHTDSIIIAITFLIMIATSIRMLLRQTSCRRAGFFRCCTFVTLAPMACLVAGSSILKRIPDFSPLQDRFGLMYLFFAIFGWGALLQRPAFSSREGIPSP